MVTKKIVETSAEVIEKLVLDITPLEQSVKDLEIADADGYADAAKLLNDLKYQAKIVKERKEKYTVPAYKLYKSLMDEFRPTEQMLERITKMLKPKMVAFKAEEERLARVAAERLQARLDKGTMRPDTVERKMNEIETTDNKEVGVQERKIKKARIIDAKAFPWGEYMRRDSVLAAVMIEVRKDALGNAAAGIPGKEIAGVEVYEETII